MCYFGARADGLVLLGQWGVFLLRVFCRWGTCFERDDIISGFFRWVSLLNWATSEKNNVVGGEPVLRGMIL